MLKRYPILLVPLLVSCLFAQWSQDPNVNTVLDKPGDQTAPLIATDGKGGAIVAWDEDNGVFAKRVPLPAATILTEIRQDWRYWRSRTMTALFQQ